jgi:hypothetical protein
MIDNIVNVFSKYGGTTSGITMLICAPVGIALIFWLMSRGGDDQKH